MFFRQSETTACSATPGSPLRKHLLDQQFTRLLIDRTRPTLGARVNILDLLIGQQPDVLPSPFQPQRKIFARFVLGIGLKLDGVIALFAARQSFQPSQQFVLGKQKDVRTPFVAPCSEYQQILQRNIIQLIRIIDQQVNLLTGQRQLSNLSQDRAHISLSDGQALRHLAQQRLAIRDTLRNDDALHRLLVGTRNQRLTQQRLAATFRPHHRQQELAVARKVM